MTFSLEAQKREGKSEELRAAGIVPAVVYGKDMPSVSVQVEHKALEKVYQEAGTSGLVDLKVNGGEMMSVLIQDMQFHPTKNLILHADFRKVEMGKEVSATVDLNFVGEAPAVKGMGGTLSTSVDSINVTALPKDLESSIDVDLSTLATFEDAITVGDLNLPGSMTASDDPSILVAKVAAPKSAEEIAAAETTEAPDMAAVVGEDKPAEGEEKPAEEKKEE